MASHTHSDNSRLWLALRLPDLPCNAQGFDAHKKSLLVIDKQKIFYASPAAQTAGVTRDMDITTAQLLCEGEVINRNAQLEKQRLLQLMEDLYQFTPYIKQHFSLNQHGLLLELSRCLKLFKGLPALSESIFEFLKKQNIYFVFGLGHTSLAAWILSFQPNKIIGNENKALFTERLYQTTLDILGDNTKTIEALNRSGFMTLGDIARQIEKKGISSLRKRFGDNFSQVLCDIFDIEQNFQQQSLFKKPVENFTPREFFLETLQFDYPVSQVDQLKPAVELMLKKLEDYLRKRQQECQSVQWRLFNIFHDSESFPIYCDTPQSRWMLPYELTCIYLDNKALTFEVDTLELRCDTATAIQSRAQALSELDPSRKKLPAQNLNLTSAKLKTFLGEDAVFKISYHDSHIPEQSNITIPLKESSNQNLPGQHTISLRPNWLLEIPQAIQQRKNGLYWHGYLQLHSKPERIETDWWNSPKARDYYLAQREDNLRLWVFCDLYENKWYVQGVFS